MTHDIARTLLQLNLKEESVVSIENLLSENIIGHMRPTISTSFEGLFRARKITKVKSSDLHQITSIWYPNWQLIPVEDHVYNRCSDKGKNFFYSSNYLEAVIKELNPENGDRVLIGLFHPKFPGTKVRSQYAGIESLKSNPNYRSELATYKYASENDRKIEEVLSSKFQDRVSWAESFKYKLSIAFSNILLKNEDIECIIYPSVASNLKFVNYGIKPSFVDNHLYCHGIFQYSVEKDRSGFTLTPEKFGVIEHNLEDQKNSKINWNDCSGQDKAVIIKYSL